MYAVFIQYYREHDRYDEHNFFAMITAAGDDAYWLSEEDMAIACIISLAGGGETTQSLIGNLFYLLTCHPEQLQGIRQNHKLIVNAISEILRFASPLQMTRRLALEDAVIDGLPIRQGERILLCLGTANRDPEHYGVDANKFDISRRSVGKVVHADIQFARPARLDDTLLI